MGVKAETVQDRRTTQSVGRGVTSTPARDGLGVRFAYAVKRLWSRGPVQGVEVRLPADAGDGVEDILFEVDEPDEVWLQNLWGQGFLTPGGKDYVIALVRDLQLSPAINLLELEPGLGGSTRAVAGEYGAYVAAFECRPGLAEQAMDLSMASGFAKKAAIKAFDPKAPGLGKGLYDHAFAKDGMLDVGEVDELLRSVQRALKPKGQFIVARFMSVGDGPIHPDLAVLTKSRSVPAWLCNKVQMVHALGKAGFSITHADDTGAAIRSGIARSWAAFAEDLKTRGIAPRQGAKVLSECAQWVRISAMIEEGTLEHVTIRAKRP